MFIRFLCLMSFGNSVSEEIVILLILGVFKRGIRKYTFEVSG